MVWIRASCFLFLHLQVSVRSILPGLLLQEFLCSRILKKDYEEAAYVDGAGYFTTMVRIIMPMAKPSWAKKLWSKRNFPFR